MAPRRSPRRARPLLPLVATKVLFWCSVHTFVRFPSNFCVGAGVGVGVVVVVGVSGVVGFVAIAGVVSFGGGGDNLGALSVFLHTKSHDLGPW